MLRFFRSAVHIAGFTLSGIAVAGTVAGRAAGALSRL